MARLVKSTVLRHPETDEPTFLEAGSEVPTWASELVGEHLLDEEKAPAKKTPAAKKAAASKKSSE